MSDDENDVQNAQEAELVVYTKARLREAREWFGLSVAEFAELAGYDRSAMHRLLKNDTLPSVILLHNLSATLNIPPQFWFPPRDASAPRVTLPVVPPRPARYCVCQGESQLTKKNVKAIGVLSAENKQHLLNIIKEYGDDLDVLIQTAQLLRKLDGERRKSVLVVVEQFYKKSTPTSP